MIKFVNTKDEITVYDKEFNEISRDISPIKEILKKGDISEYSLIDPVDDTTRIPLGDAFHLQVNAKDVGEFHFLFKSEGFKKEEVIKQIATLKEITVRDAQTARHKIVTLINIVKDYNPLFAVYAEYEGSYLYMYEIDSIFNKSMPCLAIPQEVKEEEIKEFTIGNYSDDLVIDSSTSKPKAKRKFKFIRDKEPY